MVVAKFLVLYVSGIVNPNVVKYLIFSFENHKRNCFNCLFKCHGVHIVSFCC